MIRTSSILGLSLFIIFTLDFQSSFGILLISLVFIRTQLDLIIFVCIGRFPYLFRMIRTSSILGLSLFIIFTIDFQFSFGILLISLVFMETHLD